MSISSFKILVDPKIWADFITFFLYCNFWLLIDGFIELRQAKVIDYELANTEAIVTKILFEIWKLDVINF